MSGQHTPGPWVLVENSWDVSTIYGLDGDTVAECPISGLVSEDTQDEFQAVMNANARLIAAAPKLLEALTLWRNNMRLAGVYPMLDSNDPMQHALAVTETVIARARGEA